MRRRLPVVGHEHDMTGPGEHGFRNQNLDSFVSSPESDDAFRVEEAAVARIIIRCQYTGHYVFTGIEKRLARQLVVSGRRE